MQNRKEKLRIYIEEERLKQAKGIKEREESLKIETDLINDAIGCRRAGKTSLMKLEMKKLQEKHGKNSVYYINFENRRLYPLTPDYFNDLIQIIYEEDNKKSFVFLDEVQRVKNWEKYVRSIYDEFKGKIKIFISGSSSKLIKSKTSYLLSGRHLTTAVFPLNFREFMAFNDIEFEKPFTEERKSKIAKALRDYLSLGTETLRQKSKTKRFWKTLPTFYAQTSQSLFHFQRLLDC